PAEAPAAVEEPAAAAEAEEGEAEEYVAEEWKPAEAPAAVEEPAAAAEAEEGEAEEYVAEEWKPAEEPAAAAEAEEGEAGEYVAEEWKPAEEPAAVVEAEEGEAEEYVAEEWKPADEPAAVGEAAEGEAEEWKPADAQSEDAVALREDCPLAKGDILLKGRYADLVWDDECSADDMKTLERCAGLPADEARGILEKLLQQHSGQWRARLQLFNVEVAAARPFYAYVTGRPLMYAPMSPEIRKAFRRDMAQVINDMADLSSSPSEERWKCLRLAELELEEHPRRALEYVNKALSVRNAFIKDEASLYYYRQCLASRSQDSFYDCIMALQNVDNRVHLFKDLCDAIANYCQGYGAFADLLNALLYSGRSEAKRLESGCDLSGEEFNSGLLGAMHDDNADLLLELVFNQLYQRIEMPDVTSRTPSEISILEESERVHPAKFPPVGMLRRLNQLMFKLDYDVRVYNGPKNFWVRIIVGERQTIVLHKNLENLDSVTQQSLLMHRLFQMYHRHHIVRRIHDVMTNEDRLHMLNVLCDISKDTGADPGPELRGILADIKVGDSDFEDKLERLVTAMQLKTGSFELAVARELMFARHPFTDILDASCDRFVARLLGMTDASYSIALQQLGNNELLSKLEQEGFSVLYGSQYPEYYLLRLRLQRLWTSPLQEELWY
ncbi:hypothetical protein IJT17_00020, partial [bacterium]|nr:hypothetical protein [bacterium]